MANKSFVIQYIIKAREQAAAAANKVTASYEKMRLSVDKARKSFAKFSEKARRQGLILSAALTAPILLIAKSLKDAARDSVETESKFATVFKDISQKAEESAKSLSKNYGLSGVASKRLISDTGDLLTGFGFTQDSALDLSTKVNQLAVDLASFANFSGGAEGASQALTKALLGERESLKSLGVAISEKQVKEKIGQLVAKGQKFQTLQQAKAQATLALAIEQSKNAIGDFARTQGELANQERILAAETEDLKVQFGKALLPISLMLTKSLRKLVDFFSNLSPEVKKTILVIAGVVAVVGPLLLIIGGISLALPVLAAGFASVSAAAAFAFGPAGIAAAALALIALIVINNWDKVTESFSRFGNEVQLVKDIINGLIDLISKGLGGVGEIIGQTIGAIASLDFGQFDIGAIKSQFLGESTTVTNRSKVDVGVNVGLDPGLKQTTKPAVASSGTRRTDVGLSAAGA